MLDHYNVLVYLGILAHLPCPDTVWSSSSPTMWTCWWRREAAVALVVADRQPVVEEQQRCQVPQLLLHVSCEHLQGVWPRRSEPKCSSSSCDDRGSEDARKNIDEADISKANLQEELDVFLKVCLGLQEAENWARVVVVRGLGLYLLTMVRGMVVWVQSQVGVNSEYLSLS